jgi:hypothetical protein
LIWINVGLRLRIENPRAMLPTDQCSEPAAKDWRPWLRGRIVGLILAKLLALAALWALFFSPSHRPATDAATLAARWLAPAAAPVKTEPTHD